MAIKVLYCIVLYVHKSRVGIEVGKNIIVLYTIAETLYAADYEPVPFPGGSSSEQGL